MVQFPAQRNPFCTIVGALSGAAIFLHWMGCSFSLKRLDSVLRRREMFLSPVASSACQPVEWTTRRSIEPDGSVPDCWTRAPWLPSAQAKWNMRNPAGAFGRREPDRRTDWALALPAIRPYIGWNVRMEASWPVVEGGVDGCPRYTLCRNLCPTYTWGDLRSASHDSATSGSQSFLIDAASKQKWM